MNNNYTKATQHFAPRVGRSCVAKVYFVVRHLNSKIRLRIRNTIPRRSTENSFYTFSPIFFSQPYSVVFKNYPMKTLMKQEITCHSCCTTCLKQYVRQRTAIKSVPIKTCIPVSITTIIYNSHGSKTFTCS